MTKTTRVFDPRKNENYVIHDPKGSSSFSSLTQGCMVLEGSGGGWDDHADRLDALFGVRGERFCYFDPWRPGVRERIEALTTTYPNHKRFGDVVLARIPNKSGTSNELLKLRLRLGGNESGVWAFGSTRSVSELSACLGNTSAFGAPAEYLFESCITSISAVLCLEEGDQWILLARLAEVEEVDLDSLLLGFTTAQHSGGTDR